MLEGKDFLQTHNKDCPTKGCHSRNWKLQTTTLEKIFCGNMFPTVKEERSGNGRDESKKLISRITKFRRVCRKCGYEGVWRYANLPTDVRPQSTAALSTDPIVKGGKAEAQGSVGRSRQDGAVGNVMANGCAKAGTYPAVRGNVNDKA